MVRVSGIGPWPGIDVRFALQALREDLGELSADGVTGLPYLPQLSARGPGADTIGRTAHLLQDLHVDLQPQGWRLVDRPGLDASRTASLWRQDTDQLAEVFEGYDGEFKVQVCGPWTLARELWLPYGDRVLSDTGAVRELGESWAAGIGVHLSAIQRILPHATVVLQVDEPSLTTVLAGHVPSASGYRRLPAPNADQAAATLRAVLSASVEATLTDIGTALYCPGRRPSLRVMRAVGPGALAIDVTQMDSRRWESVAVAVEAGIELWAGVVTAQGDPGSYRDNHDVLVRGWRDVGLTPATLSSITLTPAGGMAELSPQAARALSAGLVALARDVAETAAG